MEIKITIDCTPEEARTFFGLPDVTPLNDALIKKMQERMEESFDQTSVDALMKNWMQGAAGMGKNMTDFQSMFFNMMSGSKKD